MRGTILPLIMLGLGVAILVRTAIEGASVGAAGYLFGVLFCLAGGLRLWFERRAPR